eukprot:gene29565-5915_t
MSVSGQSSSGAPSEADKSFALKLAIEDLVNVSALPSDSPKLQLAFQGLPANRVWIQGYVHSLRGNSVVLSSLEPSTPRAPPSPSQKPLYFKVNMKFILQDVAAVGLRVGHYIGVVGSLKPSPVPSATSAGATKPAAAGTPPFVMTCHKSGNSFGHRSLAYCIVACTPRFAAADVLLHSCVYCCTGA